MNKKHIINKAYVKKCLSYFLSIVLTVCLIGSAHFVNAENINKTYTVVEDGVTYTITEVSGDGEWNFMITSDDSKDKTAIEISEEEIIVDEYEYSGKNIFGKDKFDKSEEVIDISEFTEEIEDFDNLQAQAISYGSKTTEKIKKKFWYSYGNTGSKTYLKIGHTASYQIRTDNLSSSKEAKCNQYVNAIKKCNSSYLKALAAAGGSSAILGIAAGLVLANIALPPTVIITLAIAVVGGGSGMVAMINYLIDASEYYQTAKERYNIIKTYGTKL